MCFRNDICFFRINVSGRIDTTGTQMTFCKRTSIPIYELISCSTFQMMVPSIDNTHNWSMKVEPI